MDVRSSAPGPPRPCAIATPALPVTTCLDVALEVCGEEVGPGGAEAADRGRVPAAVGPQHCAALEAGEGAGLPHADGGVLGAGKQHASGGRQGQDLTLGGVATGRRQVSLENIWGLDILMASDPWAAAHRSGSDAGQGQTCLHTNLSARDHQC